MVRRLAGRIVTGPLAFLAAGAVDVAAAWGAWAAGRVRARLARRPSR
jgi:hypothetical protein